MMREGGRGECPQNDTGVRTRGALSDDTGGRTRRVLSDETGGRLGQTRAGSQMIREGGRERCSVIYATNLELRVTHREFFPSTKP